jgi:hypothetical protein
MDRPRRLRGPWVEKMGGFGPLCGVFGLAASWFTPFEPFAFALARRRSLIVAHSPDHPTTNNILSVLFYLLSFLSLSFYRFYHFIISFIHSFFFHTHPGITIT